MHVELADVLRCPASHAESWLVLAADRTEQRVVLDGMLGCPVCGAEYAIVSGVVRFDAEAAHPATLITSHDLSQDVSDDDAMRAAALLHATSGATRLAFVGASLALAAALQRSVPARCVVLNAPDTSNAVDALLRTAAPMVIAEATSPRALAAGSLDGLWVATGDPAAWAVVVRARGRLVASVTNELPAGFVELARDGTQWVAERSAETATAPASLVQLRRRR